MTDIRVADLENGILCWATKEKDRWVICVDGVTVYPVTDEEFKKRFEVVAMEDAH